MQMPYIILPVLPQQLGHKDTNETMPKKDQMSS